MTPDQLKDLYLQSARVLARRPELALASGQTRVVLADGLRCEVEHEGRLARIDLAVDDEGAAPAGHPDALMRASLGASLVTGYALWAARLDVPIGGVCLEIACAFDARGQLGLEPAVAVGWQQLFVHVTIASEAPAEDLRRVVETADRLSPMLANLSPEVRRVHRLTITRCARPAAAATERSVPSEVTPREVQDTTNQRSNRKDTP